MDRNPTMNLLTGVPNAMLQSPSVQGTLKRNQENLYAFLEQHSAYFRQHAAQIKRDTAFDKVKHNA